MLRLLFVFLIFFISINGCHAAGTDQIAQKKQLILKALKRIDIDCQTVLTNMRELEKLTKDIPSTLFYYTSNCFYQTHNKNNALKEIEKYFLNNRKKNSIYQRALILRKNIKTDLENMRLAKKKAEKQAKLAKIKAEKDAELARVKAINLKNHKIEKLNKENLEYIGRYFRNTAKLKKQFRGEFIKNCNTFKAAKNDLKDYPRHCIKKECKADRRYWKRELNAQKKKMDKLGERIDKLIDMYDEQQYNVSKKGGEKISRYKKNPYLSKEWNEPSCSSVKTGSSLSSW